MTFALRLGSATIASARDVRYRRERGWLAAWTCVALWPWLSCAAFAQAPGAEKTSQPEEKKTDAPAAVEPAVPAAPTIRVFEQVPFDEIHFKSGDPRIVKVLPIANLGNPRALPENPKPGERVRVRKFDDPTKDLDIEWRYIEKIRLLEDMILDEAEALIKAENFDAAYDYYQYMRKTYPNWPRLKSSRSSFLYRDAFRKYTAKKNVEALVLLNALYEYNPQHAQLPGSMGNTVNRLIDAYVKQGSLPAARAMHRALKAKFPDQEHVIGWETRWTNEAQALVDEAGALLAEEKYREAQQKADRALAIWPSLPAARTMAEEIYSRYPLIEIGVNVPSPPESAGTSAEASRTASLNWGARRDGRLLNRYLLEFAGASNEGGKYLCPFGTVGLEDVGLRLAFKIRPNVSWSEGGRDVTGYDVSRLLMGFADREAGGSSDWADLLSNLAVRRVYEVDVGLRFSHVRPEALLQIPLTLPVTSDESTDGGTARIGAYNVLERDAASGLARFVARPKYFAAKPGQPKEIVERYFPDGKEAIKALKRGEIRLLDRVNPWDVEALSRTKEIQVRPYAIPTVHCLLVNLKHPFLAKREFRRALQYGVNRELILRRHLLREKPLAGCLVVSGPFPASAPGEDDPLRYGANPEIKPRPYDAGLALLLATVTGLQIAKSKVTDPEKLDEAKPEACPTLRLAHPPHEVAKTACEAIKKHLEVIKIPIELVSLPPGVSPPPVDYDLVYTELVIQEPLVDARRLLAADGVAGGCSAWMAQGLKELDQAAGWADAREKIHKIHRMAYDDGYLIPLWQITEHFAYHQSLSGPGARPSLLFESVENWKCEFRFSEENP